MWSNKHKAGQNKSFSGGAGGEPFSKGSPQAGFGAAAPIAAKPQRFKAPNSQITRNVQTTLLKIGEYKEKPIVKALVNKSVQRDENT